jgi:MFS family permease
VAALLAILIGAPVAAMTDFTPVITFSAVVAVLATPIAFTMHEVRRDADAPHDPYFRTLIGGLREVWELPRLRYIILYAGITSAAAFSPQVFQQPFLSHHGVPVGSLGVWQAPVRGAGVLSALLAHRFLAVSGQRGAFFAMPVTLTLCSLAVAGIDHSWVFVAFLGMGVVAGMQSPLLATYINKCIPSERRATILSVQSVVGNLIYAGIWPLNGVVADAFGLRALFLMFAVLTAVFGLASAALWSRAEARETAMLDDLGRALLARESEAIAL